jgi:hypothetical protein
MRITLLVFILLAASVHCALGQTDTNWLAVGPWSQPVSDGAWPLRGRLLVYQPLPEKEDEKKAGLWNAARVYLELQLMDPNIFTIGQPAEIFIDRYLPLHCEMRDHLGAPVESQPGWRLLDSGPPPPSCTVTLTTDSTVRLRASTGVCAQRPSVLKFAVPEAAWALPKTDTNAYFLSATFTPPTNHPSALGYHPWVGTLQLPPVKIRADQSRSTP